MLAPVILPTCRDDVAVAVLTQDWPRDRAVDCLPFHRVPHPASLHIFPEKALRAGFDRFSQTLRLQNVSDYMRLVEGAERLDEVLITGRHVTHVMSGGQRILPPFRSQITLRLEDGQWRAASITNAIANSRWPIFVPGIADSSDQKGSDT